MPPWQMLQYITTSRSRDRSIEHITHLCILQGYPSFQEEETADDPAFIASQLRIS